MEKKKIQDPDSELVARILDGDKAAFETLVELYHPRIFRLTRGIIGDYQRSEDVCQDIFVNVFLKLSSFGFRSKFSTWMYRVAVNAALKARGKAARLETASLEEAGGGPAREDGAARELEGHDLVGKLLRPLPAHLRATVLLKEKEGLTYREIAKVLGCSPGAVEQRLHRAFTLLREIWKDRKKDLGLEGEA